MRVRARRQRRASSVLLLLLWLSRKDQSALLNFFSTGLEFHRNYSSWAYRGPCFNELREITSLDASSYGYSHIGSLRKMFLRSFTVDVSGLDKTSIIKHLRERTSAPIKEVKSALVNCNWDIEAAQKDLRKRGVVLASKKSSRTAAEGLLALVKNDKEAAVIELNCETDFVARNEVFQYLALSLANKVLSIGSSGEKAATIFPFGPEYLEELKINLSHEKLSGETTVQSAITEVAAMVGENVKLRRGFRVLKSPHGVISSYLHSCPQPGLGRFAGIVTLEPEVHSVLVDALQQVGSQLAMHVVASKPLFLSKDLVPSEALENERDILKSQAESTGKSQLAVEKMVEGRLKKYLEEVVFMEQKFIVNDSVNVKSLIDNLSREVGSPVKVSNFLRLEVGEGIQRVEASNAPEGLAQAA
ncbi:hypothetical protein Syun_010592 [Stephania yunnanensis]|uniref:Elongation factor Ts, mitochondrial n=1 Tax=Stephania yunnanensis TaxID=152371 RepID=A0AAP0KIB9_9MAGN